MTYLCIPACVSFVSLLCLAAAQNRKTPIFQLFREKGLSITIPGPYDESDQPYRLSFHVNVNQDIGSSRSGQYNGEVVIPSGGSWTFTVPDVRVKYFDTIWYLVEVRGQLGRRIWKREHRGYYQVPVQNPHGSGVSSVDNRVQPNTPVLVNHPPQNTNVNINPVYSQPGPVNPQVGWSDSPQPSILYLEGSGIRVNLPGPYEQSNVYLLKYRVDVNREVNGVNDGLYKGEVTIPKGNEWSFTVPDIRVRRNDRIYYWVEVSGQDGSSIWSRNFRGYNYVNDLKQDGVLQLTPTQVKPVSRPEPMLPSNPPNSQLPRFTTEPSTFLTSPPHKPTPPPKSTTTTKVPTTPLQNALNSPDTYTGVSTSPDHNLDSSNFTVHNVEDSSNFTLCNSTDGKDISCTIMNSEINKNDSSHTNVASFSAPNQNTSYYNSSNSQTNNFDTTIKFNSTDCTSNSCKYSYHHSSSSNSSTYNSSFYNSSTHNFSPNGNSQSHNYAHSNMKVDRWSSFNTYRYNNTYY